jgi:hypothetical protein
MNNHRTRTKFVMTFFAVLIVTIIISRTVNLEIPLETGIIGTMYTFFYGLYINSLLNLLDEKFINFRLLIGDIIGRVQSIYNISLLLGNKNVTKKMKKELVLFLKSFNDLPPEKYYHNQENIDRMYTLLKDYKIDNDKDSQNYSRILQLIDDLSIAREKMEIFGRRHLTTETKIVVIATTALYLIIIAFLTLASTNIYLNILGSLFVLMVIFVMIFMFNLDNLTYGTHTIKTKNIESLIRTLEKENPGA